MDNDKILFCLQSLDKRVSAIEKSITTINYELGVLLGNVKTSIVPTLIRYVIFPLLIIMGGLVGIRLVF